MKAKMLHFIKNIYFCKFQKAPQVQNDNTDSNKNELIGIMSLGAELSW